MPKRTPIAIDEAEFETDERPTQPGAPTIEALEAMRDGGGPKRARVRPRSRPALAPATQSWLHVKTRSLGAPLRTATSRIRAVASVLLAGGAGRASLVDEEEAASTSTVVPRESGARRIATAALPSRDRGPTGTMKLPARPPRVLAPTVMLPARARARRWRGVRAWLLAAGAGVLCVIAVFAVLRAVRGKDVARGAAPAPTVVAAAPTPSPSPSVPAVELPTSIDLPAPAPVAPSSSSPAAAPRVHARKPARRAAPQTGSSVF